MKCTTSFFAVLLISTFVLAQDVPAPPPMVTPQVGRVIYIDELGRLTYDLSTEEAMSVAFTLAVRAQTEPILFINNVGDTLGVAKQLTKRIRLTKAQLLGLSTSSLEVVASPGAGRAILPRYIVEYSEGTFTLPTAAEGNAIPAILASSDASGYASFFSTGMGLSVAERGVHQGGIFSLAPDEIQFTNLPSASDILNLYLDTPLKVFPLIYGQGTGLDNEQTWSSVIGQLSDDYAYTAVLYYQIFDTR